MHEAEHVFDSCPSLGFLTIAFLLFFRQRPATVPFLVNFVVHLVLQNGLLLLVTRVGTVSIQILTLIVLSKQVFQCLGIMRRACPPCARGMSGLRTQK